MLVFERDGGYQAFSPEALGGSAALCHAMTVHKAQGSEYDTVAVVLPDRDLPLLTREILYTGVTRSRRSVILIGKEDLLVTGIERSVRRFSGLPARIDEALSRPGPDSRLRARPR
jgi:exodeoxyribonuclease V alpha subunit